MDIYEVRGVFDLLEDMRTSHGVLTEIGLVICVGSLVYHFDVFDSSIITLSIEIFSNWWFQSIGILS